VSGAIKGEIERMNNRGTVRAAHEFSDEFVVGIISGVAEDTVFVFVRVHNVEKSIYEITPSLSYAWMLFLCGFLSGLPPWKETKSICP
jgi:hypothetical protein